MSIYVNFYILTIKLLFCFVFKWKWKCTKIYLHMFACVTKCTCPCDIIHFEVFFTLIVGMMEALQIIFKSTMRSNSLQYSLLTGSIPRGYGPLKTPVTFGSRVRKLFPWTSSSLSGTHKTRTIGLSFNFLKVKISLMHFWVCLFKYLLPHRLSEHGLHTPSRTKDVKGL